jgi:hypothetical protein
LQKKVLGISLDEIKRTKTEDQDAIDNILEITKQEFKKFNLKKV